MIPLRDNIPSRTTPFVNYAVIGICSLVFLAQLGDERDRRATLVEQFGMVPYRVFHPDAPLAIPVATRRGMGEAPRTVPMSQPPFNPWLTTVTCIFLHGGWLHFLGNMWFLYIFGDNVEDRMGHLGYALFYLGGGVFASLTHLFSSPGSPIPTIGASGAIAAVMGAYLLLYPRATVVTLIPIFYFMHVIVLPAPAFLAIWFVIQLIQGVGSISLVQTTGVAWWAHIGGFAAGFLVALGLRAVGETRPPVEAPLPDTDRIRIYRPRRF